jgi:hypothetical protein
MSDLRNKFLPLYFLCFLKGSKKKSDIVSATKQSYRQAACALPVRSLSACSSSFTPETITIDA